jgi:hypothetical protein
MQGGLNKKKKTETPTTPLRNLLGTYDQPIVSTPLDQNLNDIAMGTPVNLQTMLAQPQKKVNVTKDKLGQINLGNANTVADLKTSEVKPKDVKNISKQVTQAIVEKKAAEDPSWFERNKKGLRDAGIILSGALASFGEGIKGGNQTVAGERMMANLDAASKADEQAILDDPNSEESKRSQALFKQLFGNRVQMPENMTASQFRQLSPVFERIDAKKLAQARANAPKALPKSDSKISNEYRDHINALDDTIEQAKLIKKLNRTSVGSILPDTNKTTKALVASINAKSLNQAKAAAGPGAFTDAEREIYVPLTANANESSDTALEKIKTNVTTGMNSTMRKLDSDLRAGNINADDYDRLVTEYDSRLRAFGMGLDDNNQVVPLRGR